MKATFIVILLATLVAMAVLPTGMSACVNCIFFQSVIGSKTTLISIDRGGLIFVMTSGAVGDSMLFHTPRSYNFIVLLINKLNALQLHCVMNIVDGLSEQSQSANFSCFSNDSNFTTLQTDSPVATVVVVALTKLKSQFY